MLRAGSEGGLAKFSEEWEPGLGRHITGHPRYPEAPVLAPDSAVQPHCRGERDRGAQQRDAWAPLTGRWGHAHRSEPLGRVHRLKFPGK